VSSATAASPSPAQARPDVVVVLVDDLGWRDLSCYGSTFHETPRLDRLAAEGVLFTDAYAASPVCSPSRASLMTGRYPATHGVTDWIGGHSVGRLLDVPYFHHLPLSEESLASALATAGYRTWHVGKWHLGTRITWPEQHGFEVNLGGCELGMPPSYFSPYGIPNLPDGPPGEYLTDRLTDEAVRLVGSADERPFLLNLWHYAVHTPVQAPADLVAKYERKAQVLGLDRVQAIEDGEPMPGHHLRGERVRRRRLQSDPVYAAMVENLDTNVGRLLDAVERAGRSDRTVVVVTSDNGGLSTAEGSPTCNAPLAEGKGWMQDGGIRVPLLVRWPGVTRPGSRCSEPTTTPDLFPTLLAAAGVPLGDRDVDGVSLEPLLRGEAMTRGPVFWHYPHYGNQGGTPSAGVRDGRLKLVRWYDGDVTALYDLEADIAETTDLSADLPEHAARLRGLLEQWLQATGARIPGPNPRHVAEEVAP
jgi:arylsulfatase A-like enzyme